MLVLMVSTTTAVIPPEFYSGVGKRENEDKNQKGKNVKNVVVRSNCGLFFSATLEEDDIFASIRGTIEEEEEEVVNIKV